MTEEKSKGMKPDYNVTAPVKNGEKTFWAKIGGAWKSDKGISIKLTALPLGDSIMLFPFEEKKD